MKITLITNDKAQKTLDRIKQQMCHSKADTDYLLHMHRHKIKLPTPPISEF